MAVLTQHLDHQWETRTFLGLQGPGLDCTPSMNTYIHRYKQILKIRVNKVFRKPRGTTDSTNNIWQTYQCTRLNQRGIACCLRITKLLARN